jgi:hypothetical protein
MKWWESLPEWVRWILYIPAVFSVVLGYIILLVWLPMLFISLSPFGKFTFGSILTVVSTFGLLHFSYELAPRGKKVAMIIWMVAISLGSVLGLIGGIGRVWMHYEPISWAMATNISQCSISLIIIGFVGVPILKRRQI